MLHAVARWKTVVSVAIALVLGLTATWFMFVTAGVGGLLTTAVVAAVLTVVVARRRLPSPRRTLWTSVWAVLAVSIIWTSVSVIDYVFPTEGEPVSGMMAAWARNHGLGDIVDYLETVAFSDPPSKDPAKALSLDATPVASTTTVRPRPDAPTTTTIYAPPAPEPVPALVQPALQGEGNWIPIAKAGGQDAVWAMGVRPLPEFGSVVASVALIDQTYMRAGMFNGSELPGGRWARGDRIPGELYPAAVAAFNGGFRFEHIRGGYFTEGQMVKPLRDGDATLAVDTDGQIVLGVYGDDIEKMGPWVSLRQNLILIVEDGVSQVDYGESIGVWWGADFGDEVYVPRSAVCTMKDGRLAYALVEKVNAAQLAQSLINIGCVRAMQLDINGSWPSFYTFEHAPDGSIIPHLLDGRMRAPEQRFIRGSKKEFFAFFDSTLVPTPSVLDA